ncbi:hypothetical protein C7212DRAFT_317130 [Tuber magnatum]|uniref:Uncharacterized protein n=1 Tax=Tuber magnatum TaxID=42249 RepID=A0A317SS49_9PEZI|nr:hypothetical protein C7212DRAFT_317130 [Tuber magnatum]
MYEVFIQYYATATPIDKLNPITDPAINIHPSSSLHHLNPYLFLPPLPKPARY